LIKNPPSAAFMTKNKVGLIAASVFFVFLLLGWVAGMVLGLASSDLWILRGAVWFLGAVASALVYFYLAAKYREQWEQAGSGTAGKDDIDVAVAAAEARLRASTLPGAKRLRKLPVVLVLGPTGSAKTSTVTNSGIEPELLAGEVDRGGTVAPTNSLNLWYSREIVVVEAGGGVLDEPSRWARVIKQIQPSRLAAVFSRGSQAPRMAVVCFPCDEFLKPGNSDAVPAAARKIREKLAEVSQQLGIRLPVYVVFTKADRLPYFEDYVRGMSREEAQEVLGATLPAVTDPDVGSFAERESGRVRDAFGGIYHSLALKRLDILPRESREEARAGAYEFPRELRKISGLATEFLVELCKPRQLGVSPFLRGFYFTGVRPVFLNDLGGDRGVQRPAAPQIALGATTVFKPDLSGTPAPVPAAVAGGRKVPEWTFLRRLFGEVVFQDRNAMAVTAGGRKVNLLRRVGLGLAALLAVLLAGAFTLSFANNRGLATDAFAAARAAEGAGTDGGELASLDAIGRLEELRVQGERLRQYEIEGAPTGMRWGLYTGSALLPELRRIYFDRFERVLWGDSRARLMANLRGLPDAPGASAEYGTVYDLLKAHLITTSHPDESTPEFLGPVLLGQWTGGLQADENRSALALRQFAFFGSELPFGNPYAHPPEDATIARTRVLLQQFSNVEQFYQVMISEASSEHPAVQFDTAFPGAGSLVTNSYVVPGAFTKPGWETVQASLSNVDRLFAREDWVVGERAVSAEDRVRLAQELRSRYVGEYVARWRDYLRTAAVARGSGVAATSQALTRLSGNESPLLQMLALASRNTDVDSAFVAPNFQPVHLVVPPTVTDRYISDANAPYIAALANLQSSLEQVSSASGPGRDAAMGMAISGADRVRAEVRAIAQNFSIDGEASIVGTAVQNLLQAPVAGTESLLGALPTAEVNQGGAAFCAPFGQLSSRYPFNPQATTDASIDQVNALFQRGSSALWAFYDDVLQGLMARQGSRFAARVGASPQPTPQFVEFFNRAAEFSEAIYDERGAGPAISFLLRAQTSDELPEVTINIDGQAQTFTRTFAAARPFNWQAARAQQIRISANINGRDETLLERSGPWGIFRLFQTADWESLGGDRYMLRWQVTGVQQTVAAELTMNPGSPPIFRRDYFNQLSCVPQIVR
jgi:type VI secretion system protein ImpL